MSLFLVLLQMSCTEGVETTEVTERTPVQVDLAFSVSSATSMGTRLSEDVIQTSPSAYRGIENVLLLPFAVEGKISAADLKSFEGGQVDLTYRKVYSKDYANVYYTQNCIFTQGVASCLCYAKAIPTCGVAIPTIAQKAANGSLIEENMEGLTPADITFSPDPIYQPAEVNSLPQPDAKATALAQYLTAIANTTGWSASTNNTLKTLYVNFFPPQIDVVMAGSSVNVRTYVNELYTALNDFTPTVAADIVLKNAILGNIQAEGVVVSDGEVTSLGNAREGYPNDLGLPDGAAALTWSGTAFTPQLTKTSIADINDIRSFVYPAELYYYSNSRLRSSNKDDRAAYYTATTDKTWNNLMETAYEYDNAVITSHTRAVAIKEPLQYAVARLQLALKSTLETLLDAKGKEVPVTDTSFPLTGVIVGSQYPVGFDFTPKSSTEKYLMYDSQMLSANGKPLYLSSYKTLSAPVHTLVLQTPDEEKVMLVLEFRNDSGYDFQGAGGIVYQGTKFYLIGELNLASLSMAAGDEDFKKRVFTQRYTTEVNVSVPSLAKAYNVMPNIRSPRLEVGVQLTQNWVQAETTNVILE